MPEGEYLLKKNELSLEKRSLDEEEVELIIRQQPNTKRLGIKWKLAAFNAVDSSAVANKRTEKNLKIRTKNRNRLTRQNKINNKRKKRAKEKGNEFYRLRTIHMKDSIDPRMFFREWLKYKVGQPPVIFDSLPFNKSIGQLTAYLETKGYYYGEVNGIVEYGENNKAVVKYLINTGERYDIKSLKLQTLNEDIKASYKKFVATRDHEPLVGEPFDVDKLEDLRYELSRFMKNESYYGFTMSSVSFIADTLRDEMKVDLIINIGDRAIPSKENSDSLIYKKYRKTKVHEVHFHIADTARFDGNFVSELDRLGLNLYKNQFINTIDTIYFKEVVDRKTGHLDTSRFAVIMYNGDLFVKAKVLESFNYLEKDGFYSEKSVERSYRSLLQTGIFSMIKTDLIEVGEEEIEVHYYLVPNKRQSIGFEPRATNSNGYLGVSANINYMNRNLFKGSEKLTFAISGGFESQPPVFDVDEEGNKFLKSSRTLNIFEVGPSLKLELPKFFPFDIKDISKRNRPSTVISTAYNYQERADFRRGSFQMNYMWRFKSSRTHLFQAGFPLLSVVKVIYIDPEPEFQDKLDQLNDLFLINAYSNQFVWQDWKFTYEYSNKESDKRKGNGLVYWKSIFDPAGNFLSMFKNNQELLSSGQYGVYGLGYSQFVRLDNELVLSKPIGKEKSVHMRFIAGGGYPYGNTKTSLPYDFSFYAGGANDNRGWAARSLGPGSYNYLIDTNRTSTQLGDIRLAASFEIRFAMTPFFKGAIFADVGNIWTVNEDLNRIGAQFSSSWYKELSLAAGIGLRMDLEYFIFRLDFGFPLTNPAFPPGERWFFVKDRTDFEQEAFIALGSEWSKLVPKYFAPKLHFGLGYPF